jgi:hypothetical protein
MNFTLTTYFIVDVLPLFIFTTFITLRAKQTNEKERGSGPSRTRTHTQLSLHLPRSPPLSLTHPIFFFCFSILRSFRKLQTVLAPFRVNIYATLSLIADAVYE